MFVSIADDVGKTKKHLLEDSHLLFAYKINATKSIDKLAH